MLQGTLLLPLVRALARGYGALSSCSLLMLWWTLGAMSSFYVQLPLLQDMRQTFLVAEFIDFLNCGGNSSHLSNDAKAAFAAFGQDIILNQENSTSRSVVDTFAAASGTFGVSSPTFPTSLPLSCGGPLGAPAAGLGIDSQQDSENLQSRIVVDYFAGASDTAGGSSPTSSTSLPLDSGGPCGVLAAGLGIDSQQVYRNLQSHSVDGSSAFGTFGGSSPTTSTSLPLASGAPGALSVGLDFSTQQDFQNLQSLMVDGSFALASGTFGGSSPTTSTSLPLASGAPGALAAGLSLVTLPPVPSFAIDSDVDDFNICYEYSLDFECLDPSAISHDFPDTIYYQDLQGSLNSPSFAACFVAELEETMKQFSMPVFDAICDYRQTFGSVTAYAFGADSGQPLVGFQAGASSPSFSISSTPPAGGRTACNDSPLKSSPCRPRGPRRVAISAVARARLSGEVDKKQCNKQDAPTQISLVATTNSKTKHDLKSSRSLSQIEMKSSTSLSQIEMKSSKLGRHIRTPEQLQSFFDSLEDDKFANAFDTFKFSGRLSPSKASIRRRNGLVVWSDGPNISSLLYGVGSSL